MFYYKMFVFFVKPRRRREFLFISLKKMCKSRKISMLKCDKLSCVTLQGKFEESNNRKYYHKIYRISLIFKREVFFKSG